jgi:uridine phosphorylase
MKTKKREAVKKLGAHTAVGHLHELNRWKDIPYLDKNEGMLPPFIINVGSRVRVKIAKEILNFENPVFIDEEALGKVGLKAYGRVSMLLGVMKDDGFRFPLAVVETQMGGPAAEINVKEILYFARENGYAIDNAKMESDGVYLIRAGTAGGVNSHSQAEIKLAIGDVVIASESYGSVGTVIQSVLGEPSYTGIKVADKVDEMRTLLSEHRTLFLSHDRKNLRTECSDKIVLNLQQAALELGFRSFLGANFTKDSLYAEMGEDFFAWLRDNYGVTSTEMEQLTIDAVGAEFRKAGIAVYTGLVSAAIGAIPGKSFPETEEEKKRADKAEENALQVAARALGNIAKSLNS